MYYEYEPYEEPIFETEDEYQARQEYEAWELDIKIDELKLTEI
jgi:hypothetical protein